MKLFRLALIPLALCFIPICQGHTCLTIYDQSGVIEASTPISRQIFTSTKARCWKIEVPENTYIRINIKELTLWDSGCSYSHLDFKITDTNEGYKYCHANKSLATTAPITALRDVIVTLYDYYSNHKHVYLSLNYHTEDRICAEKPHFRCSDHRCIHGNKVCDGVKDCDNGSDEIGCGPFGVEGLNASRENAIAWLLRNEQSVGWGRNIHRAITALYLTGNASFHGQNLEEELMEKKLELKASVALLRNSTDPLSVSDLSMFVNALSVTCHNPRRFYGYNLVRVLGERVSVATSPSPGAYLTLCISNWTLSQSDIHNLLKILHKPSTYPFVLDVQAMTMMALTCLKNLQGKEFTSIPEALVTYDSTVEKFINGQLSDGSFGNVYTTALVTQALIASGQVNNPKWNVTSTIQYLVQQLSSSSVDFLSASLALPIFRGKSLVDLADINCTNISRKQDKDSDISDLTDNLGKKILVQYSLFVGDQKDVIHTIFLVLPEKSSAYDVMRLAQVEDPKYKFHHRDVSGHMYVYEIAGIINDPEAEKFWLMYSQKSNNTVNHLTESPDKFMIDDGEHLIMWYKTAHI